MPILLIMVNLYSIFFLCNITTKNGKISRAAKHYRAPRPKSENFKIGKAILIIAVINIFIKVG